MDKTRIYAGELKQGWRMARREELADEMQGSSADALVPGLGQSAEDVGAEDLAEVR